MLALTQASWGLSHRWDRFRGPALASERLPLAFERPNVAQLMWGSAELCLGIPQALPHTPRMAGGFAKPDRRLREIVDLIVRALTWSWRATQRVAPGGPGTTPRLRYHNRTFSVTAFPPHPQAGPRGARRERLCAGKFRKRFVS